ncbi:ABC transporter permease [Runella sp. MFBS21]|uniref:ABC transporter permease n=1 Tax=Runella sp. MFBS21 TaxID=3034018 RepID=UPI0023F6210D|nr:ABC transporter permease [Runella sp. MFBS21]MDF7815966.1 ABC transporter permease [Runella sp. MFBS21]
MQNKPPAWLDALVKRFLPSELYEELLGDLHEQFAFQAEEIGVQKARWMYFFEVIRFCRPYFLKRRFRADSKYSTSYTYSPAMIRNYFKIAFRNLLKHKGYSFINIFGLATGMAVAMLIGLWVWDELSFNKNFKNYDHIAQVYNHVTEPLDQKQVEGSSQPQPMAKVLREKYGHIFKHVLLVHWDGETTLSVGNENHIRKGQFFENGVIDMFSLKMLKGSKESLNDPQGMILSESAAKSIFGDKDPIGEAIKLDNKFYCKVSGVYEDAPQNSTLGGIHFIGNFEYLRNNEKWVKGSEENWNNSSQRIFIQTADKVTMEQANAAVRDFYLKDAPDSFKEPAKKYKATLYLNPMKNWYLYSEFKDGYPATGRITFVWLFSIVGVFVLLLACINFMNLSTARSEKRAKEVGIRKAVGSVKSQLVNQFLGESFLVVGLAFIVMLGIVGASIGWFNELADKKINIPFTNPYFLGISFAFLTITALLSGFYPAFYLSSFEPVKVLKGTIRLGKYASLPRKVLVIVQFTVSVVLIIGTIVVYQQIQYAQNRPVGYDRSSLVRISMDDPNFENSKLVMKDNLLRNGVATNIAFSNMPVTSIWDNWGGFDWKGKNPEAQSYFSVTQLDEDFGNTIQWKVKQGRNFSKEFGMDTAAVIINESAAKYLALKNPIGEYITSTGDNKRRWQIIGVIEDLVAESPYEPVKMGLYMLRNVRSLGQMQIKINPNLPISEALAKIEATQKKLVPSAPFRYFFVDEEYSKKFTSEQRIGKLAFLFAILAIAISCLGLFGLASFIAEQRTKEIGIRKVLGASITNLWGLLSKEFVLLVVISLFIASPVAYYFMNNWIQKYSYHTAISWWIFVAAGAGALIITLLTVSFQAIKAALVNPVKSLKSE